MRASLEQLVADKPIIERKLDAAQLHAGSMPRLGSTSCPTTLLLEPVAAAEPGRRSRRHAAAHRRRRGRGRSVCARCRCRASDIRERIDAYVAALARPQGHRHRRRPRAEGDVARRRRRAVGGAGAEGSDERADARGRARRSARRCRRHSASDASPSCRRRSTRCSGRRWRSAPTAALCRRRSCWGFGSRRGARVRSDVASARYCSGAQRSDHRSAGPAVSVRSFRNNSRPARRPGFAFLLARR